MVAQKRLHPRLSALLREKGWEGLTGAQAAALGPLLAGHHVLLTAPTGHGKTEAALLPVLSRILAERDALAAHKQPWPQGFKALYVTPLRALNRDLMQRLDTWSHALDLAIGVRHGDTSQSERARQSRSPPDLLITTPETVQLLLYGDTLRRHLRTVRFVILDEVHELAASERGAQLAVALERIEQVIAQPEALALAKARARDCPPDAAKVSGFQRIGLSATVADTTAVARFLAGSERTAEVVRVDAVKELRLAVRVAAVGEEDRVFAAKLTLPAPVVAQLRMVRDLVARHHRVLVFQNTRDGAELLASRSAMLDAEPRADAASDADAAPLLGLHHGSLSPEHRADVEDRFKAGELHGLVATSSLELGIDIGAIDHIVQVHSPRSVARLVQRLGRAGHRVGAVSEGTLVAGGPEDVLECMAVARAAAEGRLEPLGMRAAPLVVLANQLVALTNEYAHLGRSWCWSVVTQAAPFSDLDEGIFAAVWQALLDLRTVYADDGAKDRYGRSGRSRRHFLDHIGLIPDERAYRVIDESTKRSVGTVDDAFVAAGLHPGALFVMAGRSWQVLEIEAEAQRVRVAPAKDLGAVPQWTGSQLPVSLQVAQEVARLRGSVAHRDRAALAPYPADEHALAVAAQPIYDHQAKGLEVPTDMVVTLESARGAMVVNVALGTRGNEALGRITQALLHQRLGAYVGMDSDAYRIHFMLPTKVSATDLQELWASLDAETLDLLVAMVLRESPLVRHHLVHVAKHFGALPKTVDPNRFSRAKLDGLLANFALHEETMDRLVHDRLDLAAVATWLRDVAAGRVRFVAQAMGPLSVLGADEARRMVAPPPPNDALLAKVRERVEASDVMMACTNCQHTWDEVAGELPQRPKCRRCGSLQIACLRPWLKDRVRLLAARPDRLAKDDLLERERIVRNGVLVASFGRPACLALVARGIGADTAARILQKTADQEDPHFWREILRAELEFARTNAYWRR
jgi:ATP-dependent Lhr-like helicase